jgi:hypothetical protein
MDAILSHAVCGDASIFGAKTTLREGDTWSAMAAGG